jgi:hypothetical protein
MPHEVEEWLPQHVVAGLFHVHARTLKTWQEERGFPKPTYVGKTPFYRAIDVRLWQERQREIGRAYHQAKGSMP